MHRLTKLNVELHALSLRGSKLDFVVFCLNKTGDILANSDKPGVVYDESDEDDDDDDEDDLDDEDEFDEEFDDDELDDDVNGDDGSADRMAADDGRPKTPPSDAKVSTRFFFLFSKMKF